MSFHSTRVGAAALSTVQLITRWIDFGVSKAELARRVNRNASSVRRLFTASQVRPELPLIAALVDALGAELRVVPRAGSPAGGARTTPAACRGHPDGLTLF